MIDKINNSSETKSTGFNYYGMIFITLGSANLLCFHLLQNVPGTVVTIFRVAIMIFTLVIITSISKGWKKLDKEDWMPMIVGGILSFTSYSLFLTLGLQKTSIINGAILVDTAPIFSMFFAVMFKQERWSWSAFAGAIVALIGVSISSFGGKADSSNSLIGDFYVLLSSLSIALGTVFAHKLGKKQQPLAQTSIMGFFGLLILLPLSINDISNTQWSAIKDIEWGMLLFIGFLGGALAFGAYFKSVEIFGASSTMAYIFFGIPISAILNFLFLHEVPTITQIVGAIIVVAGAGWSIYSRAKQGNILYSHTHI